MQREGPGDSLRSGGCVRFVALWRGTELIIVCLLWSAGNYDVAVAWRNTTPYLVSFMQWRSHLVSADSNRVLFRSRHSAHAAPVARVHRLFIEVRQ